MGCVYNVQSIVARRVGRSSNNIALGHLISISYLCFLSRVFSRYMILDFIHQIICFYIVEKIAWLTINLKCLSFYILFTFEFCLFFALVCNKTDTPAKKASNCVYVYVRGAGRRKHA